MSDSDKRLRQHQIPFQGKWFSNYSATNTGSQLANGIADGDLALFATGQSSQIRIARPMKGDLTQAKLMINAVAPDVGIIEFGFYIGSFDTDGVTPLTLSREETLRRHKLLTGRTDFILYGNQANIYWDGLNLLPFIPKRGETGFNEDAFILGIVCEIKNTPSQPFYMFDFKVDCAVTMAEEQKQ